MKIELNIVFQLLAQVQLKPCNIEIAHGVIGGVSMHAVRRAYQSTGVLYIGLHCFKSPCLYGKVNYTNDDTAHIITTERMCNTSLQYIH